MKFEKIHNIIEAPISGEWGIDISESSESIAKVIRTTNFTNIGKVDYNKEVVIREIDERKITNKKKDKFDSILNLIKTQNVFDFNSEAGSWKVIAYCKKVIRERANGIIGNYFWIYEYIYVFK